MICFISNFIFAFIAVRGCRNTGESRCCINHFELNGRCVECPPGRHGLSCNTTCPTNYYGKFCVKLCRCTAGYKCDIEKGCIPDNTDYTWVNDDWFEILTVSGLAVIILVVIILFVILYRKWKNAVKMQVTQDTDTDKALVPLHPTRRSNSDDSAIRISFVERKSMVLFSSCTESKRTSESFRVIGQSLPSELPGPSSAATDISMELPFFHRWQNNLEKYRQLRKYQNNIQIRRWTVAEIEEIEIHFGEIPVEISLSPISNRDKTNDFHITDEETRQIIGNNAKTTSFYEEDHVVQNRSRTHISTKRSNYAINVTSKGEKYVDIPFGNNLKTISTEELE